MVDDELLGKLEEVHTAYMGAAVDDEWATEALLTTVADYVVDQCILIGRTVTDTLREYDVTHNFPPRLKPQNDLEETTFRAEMRALILQILETKVVQ